MAGQRLTPPVNQTARIATLAFAAFVVIGIIALIFLSFSRQSGPIATNPNASPSAASTELPTPSETPGVHFKSQGHPGHDKKDPKEVEGFVYNSDPPTSGMHLERFSQDLINSKPLPKWMQVHLLEHGNILLQYDCNCPDIAGALAQVASLYNNRQLPAGVTTFSPEAVQGIEERGTGVIVAPYPHMPYKIALTAWTRRQTLDSIDEAKMIRFINAYLTNQANAAQ